MVKVEFRYVQVARAKGRTYYYYRRNGQRQAIAGKFGGAEWRGNYDRIHATFGSDPVKAEPATGTIAAVLQDYKKSKDFSQLKPKTRKGYLRYINLLEHGETIEEDGKVVKRIPALGGLPMAALTVNIIRKLRDDFVGDSGTLCFRPSAANGLVTFCNLFLQWHTSPKVKKLKSGGGHRPAEESEIAQFRAHHPIGTLKRMAFELALNTGQRGQDVVAMKKEDMRDDQVHLVQEKTGERVWVPMSNDLKAVLMPWMKKRIGPILTTPTGTPMREDYFRHMMREAYEEAGLPKDFTTHGLRYAAATRVYEVYKSMNYPDRMAWEAVADITGHATMQMAKKYSEQKRRVKITVGYVDAAMGSSVKPDQKV